MISQEEPICDFAGDVTDSMYWQVLLTQLVANCSSLLHDTPSLSVGRGLFWEIVREMSSKTNNPTVSKNIWRRTSVYLDKTNLRSKMLI